MLAQERGKMASTIRRVSWSLSCLCICFFTAGAAAQNVTTNGGTTNAIPKFSSSTSIANSAITDNNGNVSVGPVAPVVPAPFTGVLSVSGNGASLEFLRRDLTSWSSNPAPGDGFVWYNPDGTARLWTNQNNDLLVIKSNGEVDLVGALHFPDGTVQTTATQQGPAGPQGPTGAQGPTGPQGPQGPAGPPAHTSAVCSANIPSCPDGFVVQPTLGPCSVTSDTGSCTATTGRCAVCKP